LLWIQVNGQGQIVRAFGDPHGKVVAAVTSAFESEDGRLFLGTLHDSGVPVLDLKTAQQ